VIVHLNILAPVQYVSKCTGAYILERWTKKKLHKNLWFPASSNNLCYKQLRDNFQGGSIKTSARRCSPCSGSHVPPWFLHHIIFARTEENHSTPILLELRKHFSKWCRTSGFQYPILWYGDMHFSLNFSAKVYIAKCGIGI
jgi:hypothetical protein